MANWSKAFAGAASGLDQMSGIKMKEADYLYQDMARANRERFQERLQDDQQEFLSGMQEDRQSWDLKHKIPLEQQRVTNQGEIAKTNAEIRKTQLEIQDWQSRQSLRQGEDRIQLERDKLEGLERVRAAQSMDELRKMDSSALETAQETYRESSGFTASPQDKAAATYALEYKKAEIGLMGPDPQQTYVMRQEYKTAYDYLTGGFTAPAEWNETHAKNLSQAYKRSREAAAAFAKLPEGQRNEIKQAFDDLQQSGNGTPKALRDLIEQRTKNVNPLGSWESPPPPEPPPAEGGDTNDNVADAGDDDKGENKSGPDFVPKPKGASPRMTRAARANQFTAPDKARESEIEAIALKIAQEEGAMQRTRIAPGKRAEIMARAEKEYEDANRTGTLAAAQ